MCARVYGFDVIYFVGERGEKSPQKSKVKKCPIDVLKMARCTLYYLLKFKCNIIKEGKAFELLYWL